MKKLWLWLWVAMGLSWSSTACCEDLLQVLTPNLAAKVTHQMGGEEKLIVSVTDADGSPVRGLKLEDFAVQRGTRKAKLLSVEPLETSEEVGLNMILVLDNSNSMKQRDAISPLLSALDEFFAIVRPIDNVYAVVFDPDAVATARGRTVRTKTFLSRDVSALRGFLEKSFDVGLSIKTFLYEGILTAVDVAGNLPAKDNKIIVVFSDGEDLNSTFGPTLLVSESGQVENTKIYAIDYMPTKAMDPFLKSLAESSEGQIWKAASASELVPIFKAFSTALRHQYVVSYRFLSPPEGTMDIYPEHLALEILTLLDGSPVQGHVFFEMGQHVIPGWYACFQHPEETQAFDIGGEEDAVGRYRNVLNLVGRRLRENPGATIRIVGHRAAGEGNDPGQIAYQRAETVKGYLASIWEIDGGRMTVAPAETGEVDASIELQGDDAENRRAEIHFEDTALQAKLAADLVVASGGVSGLTLRPLILAEWGIARWEIVVEGDDSTLASRKGGADLPLIHTIPFSELGGYELAARNHLKARISVVDTNGDSYQTMTVEVPILVERENVLDAVIPPAQGVLTMTPENLTIEEVTAIDASPMLNYVFFAEGESDISYRYAMLTSGRQAEAFDESKLEGSMEKYAHVLNILGKRLAKNPDARVRIVGCNSDWGPEKGRIDISSSRAEAVRGYLKYIWGIDFSRMEVTARNLPEVPTTNRSPEGRAENQRVEIHCDMPEILDTVESTYVEEMSPTEAIEVQSSVAVGFHVKQWRLDLKGDGAVVFSVSGTGALHPVYSFRLKDIGLDKLSGHRWINAAMEVVDERDRVFTTETATPTEVTFIKREERLAKRLGYRVIEKYALILFDYDSAEIKGRNKVIVDRILARMKALPEAQVIIMGHTDSIGDERYNLKLSEKRARAVYDEMRAAGMAISENISVGGAGPHDPQYDNALPEGRALNRTVTVRIEYDKRDQLVSEPPASDGGPGEVPRVRGE